MLFSRFQSRHDSAISYFQGKNLPNFSDIFLLFRDPFAPKTGRQKKETFPKKGVTKVFSNKRAQRRHKNAAGRQKRPAARSGRARCRRTGHAGTVPLSQNRLLCADILQKASSFWMAKYRKSALRASAFGKMTKCCMAKTDTELSPPPRPPRCKDMVCVPLFI